MRKLEKLDKRFIILAFVVLFLIGILLYSFFSSGLVTVNGKLSPSDPKFKKSLESQMEESTVLLNVVKEAEDINTLDVGKNETENRVVIPYKIENSNKPLGFLIMEKSKGKWIESQDIQIPGESFDEIRLKDLDDDGEEEVIVGIGLSKNSTKGVNIFKRYRTGYKEIFADNYEKLFVDDFKKGGRNLLVLAKKDPNTSSLSLNLYDFNKITDIKMSKIMVGDIDDNLSVKKANLTENRSGFVLQKNIDNDKDEISIVVVEDNNLNAVSVGNNKSIINSRYIEAKDVNGDKIIDIPIQKETKSLSSTENVVHPLITYWNSFDDNLNLNVVEKEYTSEENTFTFEIPNSWGENIDIKEKREENAYKNVVQFDKYDSESNYSDMISIGVYSTLDWFRIPQEEKNEKNLIYKSEDKVYVLESSSGEEGTDLESVKSNFRIYYAPSN